MNKTVSLPLVILFAVIYFMFGILIMNFLKVDVTTARTALDCASAGTITGGDKITCLIVDGVIPLFILVVTCLAGGYITEQSL